mmetsp:Transcript_22395/g.88655  ORF Transcript_22395/g.88655 Transcript_22395/m.88655 type:complete len:375 (+) Transcript_22395:3126-4250(+)
MMMGAGGGGTSSRFLLAPMRASLRDISRSPPLSSSGVSASDSATAATRAEFCAALIMPSPCASWNTTKPNSPPWASRMTKAGRSTSGIFIQLAMATSTGILHSSSAASRVSTKPGCAATACRSSPMPTAMKNSPSSRPLKGSRSVSSSRRYSLSASSTPARKAPSAIDRPTACISAAVPSTSSRAAAVKISGVLLRAIQRSAGRSSSRPPKMMVTMAPTALAAASQVRPSLSPCPPLSASTGTRASTGMAAMSCSSATDRMLSPAVVRPRLRSASTASATAVDDIASPRLTTSDKRHGWPVAMPRAVNTAVQPSSCTLPQPKIGRRMAHSRLGSSSRPTRKSISTTPSSATSGMAVDSGISPSTSGPISRPATR